VIARDQLIEDLDADLFRRCLRVNLVGYMLGAKHAIPHMLRQGGGVVINTSSATGKLADNLYAIYGSSKAAIYGWTRNVATQYGKQGIRAVGLSPGLVVTKMVREAAPHVIEGLMPHTLSPDAGTPEDIAHLVAFLISDEARFITGITISIDGGFTCHLPTYAEHLRAAGPEGNLHV
jgi:NAD(P)-dependent dehydrogenase (short-subunit alcohol dehydrogenase family)